MNKKEYWAAHVAKNPKFANEENTIQITVGMLRRLMEEAFDRGAEHSKQTSDSFREIFKDVGLDLNQFRK